MVIVYSPNSTRFSEVERKVIAKARKLKGWMICKFEVKEAPIQEDAAELAKIIRKDDLVIAAGGDGTATMVANAIMQSGKIATLAVMPFGNFNDFAETLGRMSFERIVRKFEESSYIDYYPMEVRVDGEHYIYAFVYFMAGMMAEAAGVMKQPKIRKKLKRAKNRMSFSARKAFKWYLKNKWRKDLLPAGTKLNGEEFLKRTTDYVAFNGNSMIGLLPGGVWYRTPKQFWSGTMRNRSFWRMLAKFVKAMEGELPGGEREEDVLKFGKGAEVFVQVEGENDCLKDVKEILIKKNGKGLRVIKA